MSFVPVGDSQKSKRVFWEVYAWLGVSVKVATFFCHQVGHILSHRAFFFQERAQQYLQVEKGFPACFSTKQSSFENFHIFR